MAAADDLTGGYQRFEQLFDDEGVPLAQRVDRIPEFLSYGLRLRENGAQHLAYILAGERVQRPFPRQTLTVELGQPMAQSRPDLVAAIGHQEQQRPIHHAPQQEMERLQAGVVAPM